MELQNHPVTSFLSIPALFHKAAVLSLEWEAALPWKATAKLKLVSQSVFFQLILRRDGREWAK